MRIMLLRADRLIMRNTLAALAPNVAPKQVMAVVALTQTSAVSLLARACRLREKWP
jgi:hypothetical protein